MLNYNERKVLKYLQKKNENETLQSFKFVDKMYNELDVNLNLTQILLSLEKLGYIALHKQVVDFEYATTFKSGSNIMSIMGVEIKEEGLIYDLSHKKIIFKHLWLSLVLPILASVVASFCTYLIMK